MVTIQIDTCDVPMNKNLVFIPFLGWVCSCRSHLPLSVDSGRTQYSGSVEVTRPLLRRPRPTDSVGESKVPSGSPQSWSFLFESSRSKPPEEI